MCSNKAISNNHNETKSNRKNTNSIEFRAVCRLSKNKTKKERKVEWVEKSVDVEKNGQRWLFVSVKVACSAVIVLLLII